MVRAERLPSTNTRGRPQGTSPMRVTLADRPIPRRARERDIDRPPRSGATVRNRRVNARRIGNHGGGDWGRGGHAAMDRDDGQGQKTILRPCWANAEWQRSWCKRRCDRGDPGWREFEESPRGSRLREANPRRRTADLALSMAHDEPHGSRHASARPDPETSAQAAPRGSECAVGSWAAPPTRHLRSACGRTV